MQAIQELGWYLEGALDYQESFVFPIDTSPFVIGRDPTCNLTVRSSQISRRHARIHWGEDKLYITDLNSTNGTTLNGQDLSGTTSVNVGDVVRFGTVEFRVNRKDRRDDLALHTHLLGDTLEHQTGKFVDYGREIEFLTMLEHADVETLFQPVVEFVDRRVVAYEVLGRGAREGLPRDPLSLLCIGEKLKKEVELSELFRLKGLQEGGHLPGKPLLFLNTHPAETFGGEFERSLRRLRTVAPTQPIALEIHESMVTDTGKLKKLNALLKDLGIRLAYDDFGVGQARLNELVGTPPDYLKFDISMVKNLHQAPKEKRHMVNRLVDVATELGASTIAEGIETADEAAACKEMGFTHGQGYFFGQPKPLSFYMDSKKGNSP